MLFILHADHEQNCSTNAVRGVGSSDVDPYSAVAAGVAALYGPLHGGANEAVLRMLREIESVENIPDFLERVKKREEKLMGFGHRVYKNYDPRARIIQQHMDEVFEATEYNPLVEIARELEKRALDDEFFTSRKLYPNVDFYSGIIYEALEIPTNMFTVIFAIPRTAGWVAQWMEMKDDPEQKIARPRQIYTGERERDYVADRRPRGARRKSSGRRRGARNARAAAPSRHDLRRMSLSRWKLTVRHGSDVEHAGFDDLDEAVAAMRERALAIRAEGPVKAVSALRDFEPEDQVHARLQLSGSGLLRKPVAGVDVRGDGDVRPLSGRRSARGARPDPPRDAVRRWCARLWSSDERDRDRDPQGQLRGRARG